MRSEGIRALRSFLMSCAATVPLIATAAWAQAPATSTPASASAAAPSPTSQAIGEIVVTAQRRKESIQNVGIAITAMSGDQLARTGITTTQGLASQVPGLQFDSGSGGGVNAFVSIRGVTQVDPSEHQEGPNAVYLDDAYVPTTSMVGFPLYDMARAEALKGPQGTLFGRNSTGGLLQFVTNDPSSTYKGYFDASYGSYNTYRVEGAVGGPITDRLNFRLAGFDTQGDGMFKNLLPGQKNSFNTDSYGIRGKLGADLGSGWRALLTVSADEQPFHQEGVYKSTPAYVDAKGVTQYLPANVDFYGTGPGKDPWGYRDPNPNDPWEGSFLSQFGHIAKDFHYATLKVEGPVGGATLTSITNYSFGQLRYSEDTDSTPNNINTFGNGGITTQVSQELRLSGHTNRFNWTTGAYLLNLDGEYYIDFNLNIPGTPKFATVNPYTQHTQSYSAYAQVEYKITDTLKAIVGGRVTQEEKRFDSQLYDLTTTPRSSLYDFSTATAGNLAHMSHGDWTGKIQLDYQPNPDLLMYAGVSRGFRGGGFNSNPADSLTLAQTPFKAETIYDYEGGSKLRLFGGMASIRASAFYYDYHNYQAFNFLGSNGAVGNNPAHLYGGELEVAARPMTGLDISLGASTVQGYINNYTTPLGSTINTEPLKAPHLSLNGIVAKEFDIGSYQLRGQYDFNYLSKSEANLIPSPVTELPASFMQNVELSLEREDKGLRFYAFVHNLADVNRKTFGYDLSFIGMALASYAPPRTFGIGVRKTF